MAKSKSTRRARKTRIAILTGGGDCPGLNAVIRAVVKTSQNVYGWEVFGVRNGFEGFTEPRDQGVQLITRGEIAGILPRGGTILGANNRFNIFAVPREKGDPHDLSTRVLSVVKRKRIRAVVTVGGDGTQTIATRLSDMGVPVVGVPKTIDNDLRGTDRTFGFDSAVRVVAQAIDRLYTTAASHHRVMCVEVMGRHSGWIALHGGLAGGAEVILIPEIPYDPDAIARKIEGRVKHGRRFSVIVISEGATRKDGALVYRQGSEEDGTRLGGVSFQVAEELRARTSLEVRNIVLGHTQRGGSPTAFDRVLATRMGEHAVILIDKERYGHMVALRGTKMTSVPLERATRAIKRVRPKGQLVASARSLGISFGAADGSDDSYFEARQNHGVP